jgi:6-phosphogluconolactonase
VRFGREFQNKFSGGVDIALFGLGSHGQIASYWPGHPALDVEDVALLIHDAPGDHPFRVALAPTVFGQAQAIVVLASQAKRAPHVLTGLQADQQWPLARVARHPHAYWLLDRAAAGPLVAEFLAAEPA